MGTTFYLFLFRVMKVLENHFCVDLLSFRHQNSGILNACVGAYVLDRKAKQVRTILAKATILATGGAGKTYLYTSNPDVATGDGMRSEEHTSELQSR